MKVIRFNGSYFATLTRPHYPSSAFDNAVANGALNSTAAGTPLKRQIDTVVLAITSQCELNCAHCYEQHNLRKQEPVPVGRWKEIVQQIQAQGASVIILSGGEPFASFHSLLEILKSGDKNRSDFHVHTSGHGVTLERALALRDAGLVAVGVGLEDFDPTRYDALRGYPGAHQDAVNAIRCFQQAGVFTYLNSCLSRDLIRSGGLWKFFEFAKTLGVGLIEFGGPCPCGSYRNDGTEYLFTEDDNAQLLDMFLTGNRKRKYRDYPMLYYISYLESAERMGCMMGGLSHLYIDSMGNVNPCVFVPVTFGNILSEDFPEIYARMREAIPTPIHTECTSIRIADTVRKQQKNGQQLPIPYRKVEKEWKGLIRTDVG